MLLRVNRYQPVRPPSGLSRRAGAFVATHGVRLRPRPLEEFRVLWLDRGVPGEQVERMVAFEERWGGVVLPPAPAYEGGPHFFFADTPEGSNEEGWWFWAGDQRSSVPFSFMIGPNDGFGIRGPDWVPLNASVDGWVESVALAHHAALWAKTVTRLSGVEVEEIDLAGFEPVPEVEGLADQWWQGPQAYVAVYRGESLAAASTGRRTPGSRALVYSGIPEWV